jgi:hypothetical protein
MDKAILYEIIEEMKESLGAEQVLDALCMSLDSDTLEDHLRYIDRNYETKLFNI